MTDLRIKENYSFTMNRKGHRIVAIVLFVLLYYLNGFPEKIGLFLQESLSNLIAGLIIAYLFSGGRVDAKKIYNFGLSPDNDFHKKMERDWLIHSSILPTIAILLFPHPIVILSSFFYSIHVAVDLLNIHSWKGTKYTYIAVFLTTILFFFLVYVQ